MAPPLRFSIYQVLIATTAIALVVAFKLYWLASILVVVLVVNYLVPAIYLRQQRLKLKIAQRLVPVIYSRRLVWLSSIVFGRWIMARALSDFAVKMKLQEQQEFAIGLLNKALELDDTQAAYWTNRGIVFYYLGKSEEANADLTQALAIDPSLEMARAYRGILRFGQGDLAGTLEDLQDMEFKESQYALTAFYRGCANEDLGNWQQAIEDFSWAYKLDSSQKMAGICVARIQAGCPEDSIRDGNKALENATTICSQTEWKDWVAVSVCAAAYAEVGDFESACKFATLAYDLAPQDEKPHRELRIEQFKNRVPFRIEPHGSRPLN
jgi:tetratricopeptide (TPR) repeat protein